MKNTALKKLYWHLISLIAVFILLFSSVFAWFTLNNSVNTNIDNININSDKLGIIKQFAVNKTNKTINNLPLNKVNLTNFDPFISSNNKDLNSIYIIELSLSEIINISIRVQTSQINFGDNIALSDVVFIQFLCGSYNFIEGNDIFTQLNLELENIPKYNTFPMTNIPSFNVSGKSSVYLIINFDYDIAKMDTQLGLGSTEYTLSTVIETYFINDFIFTIYGQSL